MNTVVPPTTYHKNPYPYIHVVDDPYVQAAIAFLVLQCLFVAVRVYVRVFLVRAFGKDDWACVVTLVLASAYTSQIIAISAISHLVPIWEIPFHLLGPSVKLVLAALCTYIIATAALKIALALLLLRVLVTRWMVWTIYVVLTISVAYSISFFFVVLFQCGDPSQFVNKIIMGQCLAYNTINGLSYTHAVVTAGADLIFGALPVIFLWNADFTRRDKLSVGGILILGSVGCICTFIRIGWIHYLSAATQTYLVTSKGIALMSSIELSIGLVCVSLATFKPLMKRFFPRRDYYYYSEHSMDDPTDQEHGYVQEITATRDSYQSQNHGTKWSYDLPQTASTDKLGGRISRQCSTSSEIETPSGQWSIGRAV